jgi:hypothetical protein
LVVRVITAGNGKKDEIDSGLCTSSWHKLPKPSVYFMVHGFSAVVFSAFDVITKSKVVYLL